MRFSKPALINVLKRVERAGPQGSCPLCGCVEDHSPLCMLHQIVSSTDRPTGTALTTLRDARVYHGWTQRRAAEAAEVSTNYYSRIERGELPLPDKMAHTLGKIFHLSVPEMRGEVEPAYMPWKDKDLPARVPGKDERPLSERVQPMDEWYERHSTEETQHSSSQHGKENDDGNNDYAQ